MHARYLHSDCSRYPSTHDPEQGYNVRLISGWNSASYPCLFFCVLPVLLHEHVPFTDVQIIPQKLTRLDGRRGRFFLLSNKSQTTMVVALSSLLYSFVRTEGEEERERKILLLLLRIIHGLEKWWNAAKILEGLERVQVELFIRVDQELKMDARCLKRGRLQNIFIIRITVFVVRTSA